VANTRDLRNRVAEALEHGPSTIDVRESRVGLLNRIMLDVSTAHDWLNLQTTIDFPVYANRTGETTGFTVSVINGSSLVTFSSSLGADFTGAAGGMTFDGPDGESYTIVRFTSTTVAIVSPVYGGGTNPLADDWEIRAERFYLPPDCTKALRFIDTENNLGPLVIIDRRTQENMTAWTRDTSGTVYWMADDDMIYDRPPYPGWAAVGAAAAGSLTPTATYEVCYTFAYEGRESAPSPAVRVTMSSTANVISVTGMEALVLNSGIYKNVYIRQLTSGPTLPAQEVYGPWLYVTQITTETTTTATITAMPSSTSQTLYYTNGRKYMRTEWAPSEDQTLRLRYLYCPPRLVSDSDVPMWPEAFHDLLVYGPAVDLGLSQSVASAKIDRWQKRYDDLYRRFMAAQINVPDAPARRRMRSLVGGGGPLGYMVNGPVTSNYGE
jgi:hypothetical protein